MFGDTYILYADDSGDENGSFYSALLIPLPLWSTYLDTWLKFRQWLYATHGVPSRYELHAYSWINVKETDDLKSKEPRLPVPAKPDAPVNTSKPLRREITVKALKAIRSMNALGIVTCQTDSPIKAEAYEAMLQTVNAELEARDAWAVVVTDENPANPPPYLHQAHRALDLGNRRIIEDSWVQPAHLSQLIQMADLVVHCAFQAHRRKDSRRFMWDWYTTYCHAQEWPCACP